MFQPARGVDGAGIPIRTSTTSTSSVSFNPQPQTRVTSKWHLRSRLDVLRHPIDPGKLQRIDRPLIPPDAMREILVNALVHRDYTIAGGAVSLPIFDDRVEVWSAGRYPPGITAEMLTRTHPSVQRNPVIAEVFYRAGLIEKWGRGTNRVAWVHVSS